MLSLFLPGRAVVFDVLLARLLACMVSRINRLLLSYESVDHTHALLCSIGPLSSLLVCG